MSWDDLALYSSEPNERRRGGGSWKKGGSGDEDDAREGGLLSRDAFVSDGVGGPCDWSVSEAISGDGVRDAGLDGYGDEEADVGGVSRRGKKANVAFCR